MKTMVNSIFLKIGLCLLIVVISNLWFAACASGGKERGLTVKVNTDDITVFPQLGHSESVNSAVYSPDGKYIVSGSDDGTIKIWDAENGRELRSILNGAFSVGFSPDGKYIVSGSDDGTIKIWDAETGRELRTLSGHSYGVNSVAYSPDGKRIVSGSDDGTIKIWDAENGRELRTLSGHTGQVHSVAFNLDGKRIVSGSDLTIKIWDSENGRELRTLSGHANSVYSVTFNPDGKRIVSGSNDKTIKIWDVESGQELRTLTGHTGYVTSVAFSPDGKNIVSGARDWTIRIWDTESGQELRTISAKVYWVNTVAYSPDGKRIMSAPRMQEISNRAIRIWDAETGRELMVLGGYTDEINSVAYSPNGKLIASGYGSESDTEDFAVRIWDVENGRELRTLKGHTGYVTSVAFSPDGKRIVSGGGTGNKDNDYTVRIWDVESGQELRTLKGHTYVVNSIAYSPDGKRIVSGSGDNAIKIWDAETGRELRTISGRSDGISSVAFSPDGKCIVSGGGKTIKIWDAEIGRELRSLSGHTSSVFSAVYSPDGKRIVSGSGDKTIKIWDAETSRELRTFSGFTGFISEVMYSPDGKRIVSGSGDKTVKIWDAETGRELRILSGHTNRVTSVAYSPDGKHIVSGSSDNTTRIWDASTGKELARFIAFSGSDSQLASASRGLTVESQTAASLIEGEWIAITPDGFYQASPRGDRYLNVRVGNTVTGIDSYSEVFYNPNLIQARLRGLPDPPSKARITIQQAADIQPPTITIQSPVNLSTASTSTANLSVTVTSESKPLKTIKVFVNGRSAGENELATVKGTGIKAEQNSLTVTGNQKTVSFTMSLELDEPGPNKIEVLAINEANTHERRAVDVTWNAPPGYRPVLRNLWILAIGVNAYDNSGPRLQGLSNKLNFCAADAKGIIDSFKAQEGKRYAKVNSLLIADGGTISPTAENIRQNLKFLEQAGKRDVAILFLAGHGISAQEGKFFFLPKDAVFSGNMVVDASRAISADELIAVLAGSGNRLLFIDACQSGGVESNSMIRAMMKSNAFVFAASQGNENSWEDIKSGHGYFTNSVMSALGGTPAALAQGNSVSVMSMKGFVERDVPPRVFRDYGKPQNPKAYALGSADFPMAVIK